MDVRRGCFFRSTHLPSHRLPKSVLGVRVRRRRLVLVLFLAAAAVASLATLGQGLPFLGRALKPANDLGNWVSESLHDRGANHQLEERVRTLRRRAIEGEVAEAENPELRALFALDHTLDHSGAIPAEARPVAGEVVVRSLASPYVSVTVDLGRADGVALGDPVINGSGLVGTVEKVRSHSAQVRLITAQGTAVAATVVGVGVHGLVQPTRADPGHLSLNFIHPEHLLQKGKNVVTSGWRDGKIRSGYPFGLPIGVVAGGSIKEQQASARRSIRAYADLSEIVLVQVLTGVE